ncbi:MAG TPA: hypothetical protein PLO23_04175 [Alphaproteobacteria bacterium]|nr:hypothetical protein [Alphaproteobacteria bacterium]
MRFVLAFLVLALMAGPALASTTSSVGSPKVKAGNTEVALRTGFSMADDESSEDSRFRSRVHIDHGFNDTYAAKIVFSQDNRKGDNFEHDSIKFENRFYLLRADDVGFDAGIRLNYVQKDGDKKPHSVELGFYELIPLGAFELRLNQIFSDAIGDESEDGIEAEARFQLTHSLYDTHRFGFESFNDFGNMEDSGKFDEQSHTFGPVLKGDLPFGGLKYETGYRAGISEAAPDHSLKFFLSRSF